MQVILASSSHWDTLEEHESLHLQEGGTGDLLQLQVFWSRNPVMVRLEYKCWGKKDIVALL